MRSGGHRGVTPDWQFTEPGTLGQLYDLDQDPSEEHNLWSEENLDLIFDLTYEFQRLRARGSSHDR